MPHTRYALRLRAAEQTLAALSQEREHLVQAMVLDGWPAPMAREGLGLHLCTWNLEALSRTLDAELACAGGLQALDDPETPADGAQTLALAGVYRQITPAERILHIWPALPGTGVTPVLYAHLLGARSLVRPSRRGEHFAKAFFALATDLNAELLDPHAPLPRTEVVVASGSHETLDAIGQSLDTGDRHRPAPRLVGYGHRTSVAVVCECPRPGEAPAKLEREALCQALATDIAMWRGQGCFSARAVLYCGPREELVAFAQTLARAMQQAEERLGATSAAEAELARRAQALGMAAFEGQLFGQGLGRVHLVQKPYRGEQLYPQAVTLHHLASPEDLPGVLEVPAHELQGVALSCAPRDRSKWTGLLACAGATLVSAPGALQSPPACWLHDGQPNSLSWWRATTFSGL